MYNSQTIAKSVAKAATDEFNSRNYWRTGAIIRLKSENIFEPEGLYAWVRPYCFYRQLCMHLTNFHTDPRERAKIPALFGIDQKTFAKDLKSAESAMIQNARNIRSILMNIVRRAGLPSKPAYLQQSLDNTAKPYERITCRDIARTMSSIFNELDFGYITEEDVMNNRRMRPIALCRQFSMYTARYCLPERYASFPVIAKNFSGRDHTTVIHSVRKIEDMLAHKDSRATAILNKLCSEPLLTPLQQEGILEARKMPFETWTDLLRHENSGALSAPPEEKSLLLQPIPSPTMQG